MRRCVEPLSGAMLKLDTCFVVFEVTRIARPVGERHILQQKLPGHIRRGVLGLQLADTALAARLQIGGAFPQRPVGTAVNANRVKQRENDSRLCQVISMITG